MIPVKEEYINAKKNYDIIANKAMAAISQELELQKLDINDPKNDEKIVAIEMTIEKESGMSAARQRLDDAEGKLLSWAQEKTRELFTKGIIREDVSYIFTTKVLSLRKEAIELALKLTYA